jgi:hypothetical protein
MAEKISWPAQFCPRNRELTARHLAERVRIAERQYEVLASTEQMLVLCHIVLPGVTALKKLIRTAPTKPEDD